MGRLMTSSFRTMFTRHVEWSLDLAFVRDLMRTAYAGSGKVAIDQMVVCN